MCKVKVETLKRYPRKELGHSKWYLSRRSAPPAAGCLTALDSPGGKIVVGAGRRAVKRRLAVKG